MPMYAPRLTLEEVDSSEDLELSSQGLFNDEVKMNQIIGNDKQYHLLNENTDMVRRSELEITDTEEIQP